MVDQHRPQYLGFANPFTMPVAVGGYDMLAADGSRWRRPTNDDMNSPGSQVPMKDGYFRNIRQVASALVQCADLARGMARRCEAQYRRHWQFLPGLWNLYFREKVNTGPSLSMQSKVQAATPEEPVEQDGAVAAAQLYQLLNSGHYKNQAGARCKIDGDMTKLRYAEGITAKQRQVLADFSFRSRNISGTNEIRTKIGKACFWGCVVYGNGIFMTISPGERHNYLAIKLSRYRARDPYIDAAADQQEKAWVGVDKPKLEAKEDDLFEIEVPGYDLRKLILARDPLAAMLAFTVQVRVILATLLGVRMCHLCPECGCSETPCADAFGSNAEAMGGIAGRCDGFCGAVECQKVTGALHFHFWAFCQRLHQYHSLEEIATMLQQQLVTSAEFKDFWSNLCCESYPREPSEEEIETLEKNWPCFHERGNVSSQTPVKWGDERFGRIPPFVWQDFGVEYKKPRSFVVKGQKRIQLDSEEEKQRLQEDSEDYEAKFNAALMENQKCAQHHIHRRNNDTGARFIPNACQSKKEPDKCKHDFPMMARMNKERPLLVCKGIARKKKLDQKQARSIVGCVLCLRNSGWLDGTAPGLCVGFSGGNTDVKLNDRLPIVQETHEHDCKDHCVSSRPEKITKQVRRTIRKQQRTQSLINGYFGGYIGKRQKIGQLETKKCIDKMYTLRERDKGRSAKQQHRAVTGRMLTDIEMNGTARGQVEEFNLAANLKSSDILWQEFIRTFQTCSVDGQRVLHKLAIEEQRIKETHASVFILATQKPNYRSRGCKASVVDAYGFRSLSGTPFACLSLYEFSRYWQATPLLPPGSYGTRTPRTEWTSQGYAASKGGQFRHNNNLVRPGIHYVVIEVADNEYYTFADIRSLEKLRHSFVIERRPRPVVPVIEGLPLPSPSKGKDYNARYLNAFFRPWTLFGDTDHAALDDLFRKRGAQNVPHLSVLGIPLDNAMGEATALHEVVDHDKALRSYIVQGVVSNHAAQLMQTLLLNSLCGHDATIDVNDEADKSDVDEEIPAMAMSAAEFKSLLARQQDEGACEDDKNTRKRNVR